MAVFLSDYNIFLSFYAELNTYSKNDGEFIGHYAKSKYLCHCFARRDDG